MNYQKIINIEGSGTDSPIQAWIPLPKGSASNTQIKRMSHNRWGLELLGKRETILEPKDYYNNFGYSNENIFEIHYFELPNSERLKLQLSFDFDCQDDKLIHSISPESGLLPDKFVNYTHPDIEAYATQLEKLARGKGSNYVETVAQELARTLKYEADPKTRVASEVLNTGTSDCGGYHALFCSLLRCRNIPSLLCFGFRGHRNNDYHTTAYWHDGARWIQKDINDMQSGNHVPTPILPMSIGTGIDISTEVTPDFPKSVDFLQHSLIWIEGSKPKSVSKEFLISQP